MCVCVRAVLCALCVVHARLCEYSILNRLYTPDIYLVSVRFSPLKVDPELKDSMLENVDAFAREAAHKAFVTIDKDGGRRYTTHDSRMRHAFPSCSLPSTLPGYARPPHHHHHLTLALTLTFSRQLGRVDGHR